MVSKRDDGEPVTEIQTQTIHLTDDLGLPQDPILYAKPSCKNCHGRGTIIASCALTPEQMKVRFGANVQAKRTLAKGMHRCGCAITEYQKARAQVEALDRGNPEVK